MSDLHGMLACSTCSPASSIPFTLHQGEARTANQDALLKPMSRHLEALASWICQAKQKRSVDNMLHAPHTMMIAVSLSPALSGGAGLW